jgi:hypothetical protein
MESNEFGLICVLCRTSFSRTAYPFSQLLASGPLCAVCLDNVLEHVWSWGGDDGAFLERVQ